MTKKIYDVAPDKYAPARRYAVQAAQLAAALALLYGIATLLTGG